MKVTAAVSGKIFILTHLITLKLNLTTAVNPLGRTGESTFFLKKPGN